MAVLVKQSALLVVALPSAWVAITAMGRRGRRLQLLVALALVLGLVFPWLHHNWITTLGGTNPRDYGTSSCLDTQFGQTRCTV
jgi:4-amino-4-deoxy-L-arabinose transferase-like glycosyltransferase